MKTLATMILAGIMFATLSFAQANDGGAAERFRLKYGQVLPVEKPHATAVTVAARNDGGAEERFFMKWGRHTPVAANVAEADRINQDTWASWEVPAPKVTRANDGGAAERFRMKYGRELTGR